MLKIQSKKNNLVVVIIVIIFIIVAFGLILKSYTNKINQSKKECGVNGLKNISKCDSKPTKWSIRKEKVYSYIRKKYSKKENYKNIENNLVAIWQQFEKIRSINDFKEINIDNFFRPIDCMMYVGTDRSDLLFLESVVFNDTESRKKYLEWNTFNSGGFFSSDVKSSECNIKK